VYAPYQEREDSIKIYFTKSGKRRRPTKENKRYDLWDHECSAKEWAK
jgi:hypothetical protein